jgi:hypothetical protein
MGSLRSNHQKQQCPEKMQKVHIPKPKMASEIEAGLREFVIKHLESRILRYLEPGPSYIVDLKTEVTLSEDSPVQGSFRDDLDSSLLQAAIHNLQQKGLIRLSELLDATGYIIQTLSWELCYDTGISEVQKSILKILRKRERDLGITGIAKDLKKNHSLSVSLQKLPRELDYLSEKGKISVIGYTRHKYYRFNYQD